MSIPPRDDSAKPKATQLSALPNWTEWQGQYLAFIYNYTQINGRPPAEADIQRFFMTTPPTIHQMIVKLEEMGLISRVPGQARSIQLLIEPEKLPILRKQN